MRELLAALQRENSGEHIFVIAGDPAVPEGPYADSLSLIRQAPLAEYGVKTVSIAGYPAGHHAIAETALWEALEAKADALAEQGREGSIVTQFGFDADPVIAWIEQVRSRGIRLPIRIGVPGPAGIRRLLGYARRFGVGPSAEAAKKYGFSLTDLVGTAGPDRFLADLAARLDPREHGTVGVHFYTFGGLETSARWVREFIDGAPSS
ncbi:methylenetetrahydrofolate reductase [Salinicola peritrichatus]|uniref:methylenetetrahydrofolate reductase n=1 Tax=Salinicola peritrichatus TaxID=1267424 RepID=UPI0019550E42|nr:methylenetetrahydrofolate reductase [Salinicola peritrichatus]